MDTLFRVFLFIIIMPLIALCLSQNICAQPFGILSKKDVDKQQEKVLSTPGGRFAFGQTSAMSKDQFMLDTYTGRLWKISERGDIGMFLTNVPYCDSEGNCSPDPEKLLNSEVKKLSK